MAVGHGRGRTVDSAALIIALHRAEKSDYFIESQIIIDYDYYIGLHWRRQPLGGSTCIDRRRCMVGAPDMYVFIAVGDATMRYNHAIIGRREADRAECRVERCRKPSTSFAPSY